MEISINTPALLFPAISLILLAYTNRFMALASLLRKLHIRWRESHDKEVIGQIHNLRLRLRLIRDMQTTGVCCILGCVVSMCFVFAGLQQAAVIAFGISLACLFTSLLLSVWEIYISTGALQLELQDMEEELPRSRTLLKPFTASSPASSTSPDKDNQ